MRPWVLPFAAGAMAVALVAASVALVVQTRRVGQAQEHADELSREVSELHAQVRELESELEAARGEGSIDGLDDLLEGDVGGLLDGLGGDGDDLEGLLGDLLGGGGLPAMDGVPGAACLAGDAADAGGMFDGLLDGLLGGSTPPAEPDQLVDTIAGQVGVLRELDWRDEVDVDFLDDAGLHSRLDELIDEDLDRDALEAEERLLIALGAIPAGTDLEQLQRDVMDEQVAGFYVPDTGELVVRVPGDGGVRTLDQITLAHELNHALTDQVLTIPDLSEPPYTDDADAALGALAVAEGDASLLMTFWAFENLSIMDQLGMALDPSVAAAGASLDGVPEYLQRELTFPYTDGLDWICERYLEGGWEAVDRAYSDPPTTSAEVLWGGPVDAAATTGVTAPPAYDQLVSTTFGAAPLLWLVEAPGGDAKSAPADARDRVRAWAGGNVTVWGNGAATAVGLALVDNGDGSQPLCATIDDWYATTFSAARRVSRGSVTVFRDVDATGVLSCDDDDVVLAIAPDLATATRIVGD